LFFFNCNIIGQGASAVVYQGVYKGSVVAIKKLKVSDPEGSDMLSDVNVSSAFREFRRECWIMTGLEHPNIVGLKGLCMDPLCLVTEYLPHGNLFDFLHSDVTFDWTLRLKIAMDIAAGMEFLHSSTPPIIHRDLKSPNILLKSLEAKSPAVAKVADFGLSGLEHTLTGQPIQNPVWLAPEILSGEEFTVQSDVYAFGIILWELLTRENFFGEITFMTALEDKVKAGERPPIPDDCLPPYAKLIEDCWANDISRRPSFEEIARRLLHMSETKIPTVVKIQYSPGNSTTNLLEGIPTNSPSGEANTAITVFTLGDRQQNMSTLRYNTSFLRVLQPILNSSVQCMTLVGTRVWCGCSDGTISVWNTENGTFIKSFKAHQNKLCVLYSHLDCVWSGSYDRKVHMWNAEDCSLSRTQVEDFEVSCFTKVGTSIWAGALSGQILVFVLKKRYKLRETFKLGNGAIRSMLTIGPVIWVALDRNILVVETATQREVRKIPSTTGNIQSMVEIDKKVWCAAGGVLSIWDAEGYNNIANIQAHSSFISALVLDGAYVWSGGWDKYIKIWNTLDYKLVKEYFEHSDNVSCFVVVPTASGLNSQTSSGSGGTISRAGGIRTSGHTFSGSTAYSSSSNNPNNNNNNNNNNNTFHSGHVSNNNNNNPGNKSYNENKLLRYVWSGSWDKSVMVWTVTTKTTSSLSSRDRLTPIGVFRNNSSPALTTLLGNGHPPHAIPRK
jgi:serine/threonine protein kinase